MNSALFTYGTLTFPEVMEAILGYRPEMLQAELVGYMRSSLKDRYYPGIIPARSSSCTGVVYFHLDEWSLNELDEFEGDEYDRQTVTVQTLGSVVEAYTYVIKPSCGHLVNHEPWNIIRFEENHLADYLTMIRA